MTAIEQSLSAPYRRFVGAFFGHSVAMMLRRKRTILAGAIVLFPILIPLMLSLNTENLAQWRGNKVFVNLIENLYITVLSPLFALFFGCMLMGEDVESQTIPYILARPTPRTAVVVGKFLAYLFVTSAMLLPPVALTFAACTILGDISFSRAGIELLLHYFAVCVLSLAGYGSLCIFLGALTKRPIIFGIALMFGWQRLALLAPGLIDFMTIDKYVRAILPILATEREKPTVRIAMAEFQKQEFLVGASKAAATLSLICLAFLAATSLIIRWREYTSARAIGG